tara:strand:- start:255 stop:443 length:189 start_codon:yes stop_codon:yes gene_type:complete
MTQQREDLYRKNIKDLQEQLSRAHIRIKVLTEELHYLRRKIDPEATFSGGISWAEKDIKHDD